MISHKFKFAFVHIPRTGGTSFTEHVRKYCTKRSNLGKENSEFIEVSHTPLWRMKQLYFRQRNDWDDYYKFTIVRNPYDRMVSLYCHLLHRAEEDHPRWNSFKDMMVELDNDDQWKEYQRIRYGQPIFWPSKLYLCEYDNPSMLSGFIKFENMAEEIPMMLGALKIKRSITDKYEFKSKLVFAGRYPHVNKSDRKPYQEYYDDFCKSVIQKRYGWELEEFGYDF